MTNHKTETESHPMPNLKPTKRDLLAVSGGLMLGIGPSKEERALLAAFRDLRHAEMKPLVVPDALLEHGYVTKRRAAQLLGIPVKDVEAMTDRNTWRLGGHVPLLKNGTIPISELRRELSRRRREALQKLAQEVVKHVTTEGVGHWRVWSTGSFLEDDHGKCLREAWGVAAIAERLSISQAAVSRLIEDESKDGLFASRHRRIRGWFVTTEELEAYKRKLDREAAQGKAVQS